VLPVLAYVGLGMLWLWERGWVICLVAAGVWLAAGGVFSVLAARWTKAARPLLPPLDWASPQTFSPLDRDAWRLVQEEAEQGEKITFEALLEADVYIETGRRLLRRLAEHYHPFTTSPLDDVPVVELLTAFELAAEDLSGLCRQVPGGDLIALAHWKKAVQVAGYINKANDLYSFVLPFLNPVSGLARLGTREWITKPAWKSMQRNVLRWFYQAYVNRLGMHLIELLSGRLAIGAQQYRRLTRRTHIASGPRPDDDSKPLSIVVAGTVCSGKSRLIALIQEACASDINLLKARVAPLGVEPTLIDRLKEARWIESSGYPPSVAALSRRERAGRLAGIAAAAQCDLLILVVDGCRQDRGSDAEFAKGWDRWFQEHPHQEVPPALVVVTGVDRPEFGGGWNAAAGGLRSTQLRDSLVRAQFDSLRATLPPTFHQFAAVGMNGESAAGVIEHVIPALAPLLMHAERTALLRRLHEVSGRSKVGRLVQQLGAHGRSLWGSLKSRRK
jgi:hypothetical protein